ncbi:hypothetical protein J3R82DRAFT_9857 [Butyriboletus roseoflavus]|nr:hypothetical protein J3R82DRAFT_9857 [Butyriboletus roseoflavus]
MWSMYVKQHPEAHRFVGKEFLHFYEIQSLISKMSRNRGGTPYIPGGTNTTVFSVIPSTPLGPSMTPFQASHSHLFDRPTNSNFYTDHLPLLDFIPDSNSFEPLAPNLVLFSHHPPPSDLNLAPFLHYQPPPNSNLPLFPPSTLDSGFFSHLPLPFNGPCPPSPPDSCMSASTSANTSALTSISHNKQKQPASNTDSEVSSASKHSQPPSMAVQAQL